MNTMPLQDRMVTYGHEVFWRANGLSLSDAHINSLFGYPILLYPLCVFFHSATDVGDKRELNRQDLKRIIAELVGVAASAFDNDSFLLWWRDDLMPFLQLSEA